VTRVGVGVVSVETYLVKCTEQDERYDIGNRSELARNVTSAPGPWPAIGVLCLGYLMPQGDVDGREAKIRHTCRLWAVVQT